MSDDWLDDIIDIMEIGVQSNAINNQIDNSQQMLEFNQHLKNEVKEDNNQFGIEHATAKDNYATSVQGISNALNSLAIMNVTADDAYRHLDLQSQTPHFKDLLTDITDSFRGDLTHQYETATTTADQINNINQATSRNEMVLSILNTMERNIGQLHGHLEVMGPDYDTDGIPGYTDALDAAKYITDNPDLFMYADSTFVEPSNWNTMDKQQQELFKNKYLENYLAKAFKMPKKTGAGGIEYGFIESEKSLASFIEAQNNAKDDAVFRKALILMQSEDNLGGSDPLVSAIGKITKLFAGGRTGWNWKNRDGNIAVMEELGDKIFESLKHGQIWNAADSGTQMYQVNLLYEEYKNAKTSDEKLAIIDEIQGLVMPHGTLSEEDDDSGTAYKWAPKFKAGAGMDYLDFVGGPGWFFGKGENAERSTHLYNIMEMFNSIGELYPDYMKKLRQSRVIPSTTP